MGWGKGELKAAVDSILTQFFSNFCKIGTEIGQTVTFPA